MGALCRASSEVLEAGLVVDHDPAVVLGDGVDHVAQVVDAGELHHPAIEAESVLTVEALIESNDSYVTFKRW